MCACERSLARRRAPTGLHWLGAAPSPSPSPCQRPCLLRSPFGAAPLAAQCTPPPHATAQRAPRARQRPLSHPGTGTTRAAAEPRCGDRGAGSVRGCGQTQGGGMRLPPCPARRTHATAAMLSRLYTSVASGPAAALESRGSPRAGARRRASGKRPRDARAATRRDAAPCSVPPCAEMQCRVISGHPRAYQSSAAVFATAVVRGAVRSALWDRAAALGASPHCWSTAAMLAWREASPGVRAAAWVSTAAASTFKPVCCSEAASCRWRSEELPCPPPRGLSSQSRSSVACATPE